ncbi:MAG: SDR family NAD(P)-dependent oxidoreductase [Prevotellaceae bacterium]|jgi:NAD(P)-dependent dehydrogenase (short-subunit alcohol dehydrogenase family)|nr:SDR family NAD(P)-dependent oxidoreductase [Prevotellaceae bacterium]
MKILRKIFKILLIILLAFIAAIAGSRLYNSFSEAHSYEEDVINDEKQHPITTKWNHSTIAMDIMEGVDLRGKNAIVTGGYTGFGIETTKALVSAGAHVTVLARDVERAKSNLRKVENVEIEYFDLLIPESIDAVAEKFLASGKALHILINHAGIINTPLTRDKRGYELQLATNMLGHFELTAKLYPALVKANGARIVNVSSRGHRAGGVIFDDINFNHTEYNGMVAYAQSKTALILFTLKLDELAQKDSIRAFAVHPGPIPSTDIFAESGVGIDSEFKVSLKRNLAKFMRTFNITALQNFVRYPKNIGDVYKNVQQGAATSVWCAVSDDLKGKGGVYCEDSNIAVVVPNGSMAPFGIRPWALDIEAAERLWKLCEEMTGVKFEIQQSL